MHTESNSVDRDDICTGTNVNKLQQEYNAIEDLIQSHLPTKTSSGYYHPFHILSFLTSLSRRSLIDSNITKFKV